MVSMDKASISSKHAEQWRVSQYLMNLSVLKLFGSFLDPLIDVPSPSIVWNIYNVSGVLFWDFYNNPLSHDHVRRALESIPNTKILVSRDQNLEFIENYNGNCKSDGNG